jgi:hypothetical protein
VSAQMSAILWSVGVVAVTLAGILGLRTLPERVRIVLAWLPSLKFHQPLFP